MRTFVCVCLNVGSYVRASVAVFSVVDLRVTADNVIMTITFIQNEHYTRFVNDDLEGSEVTLRL